MKHRRGRTSSALCILADETRSKYGAAFEWLCRAVSLAESALSATRSLPSCGKRPKHSNRRAVLPNSRRALERRVAFSNSRKAPEAFEPSGSVVKLAEGVRGLRGVFEFSESVRDARASRALPDLSEALEPRARYRICSRHSNVAHTAGFTGTASGARWRPARF